MRIRQRKLRFEHIKPPASASFVWKQFVEPRGFAFQWHYHTEIELTLITHGRGLRFVGDSIERFDEGDLVLLGSGLPHTWSSDENSRNHRSVFVQFLPAFWGDSFDALPEMRRVRELIQRSERGLVFTGEARARAERLMKDLTTRGATPLDHLLALLSALAELSQTTGVRTLCRTQTNATVSEQVGRRLKTVLDRVHADIIDLPTQAELAESVKLSPQAFSRFFKRQVGKTFVGYVNEWRVGLACRSLLETDEPIIAVAIDSGFDNLSHFNRQFKRITGRTPSDYRRSRGEQPGSD